MNRCYVLHGLLTVLFFCLPAFANSLRDCSKFQTWNNYSYSSNCYRALSSGFGSKYNRDLVELSPWFDFIRESIESKCSSELKLLEPVKAVSCTFKIKGAGYIDNLKIVTSSGSEDVDKTFLRIVEAGSPIQYAPPNPRALYRPIHVVLTEGKLKLELEVNDLLQFRRLEK